MTQFSIFRHIRNHHIRTTGNLVCEPDIDAGNLARKEGESFKEQYETQMANARSDAHEILESAKRSASAEKKDILAQARKEADSMKEKAMQDIEREKVRSQKEMKQTITDVAFEAAGKIGFDVIAVHSESRASWRKCKKR